MLSYLKDYTRVTKKLEDNGETEILNQKDKQTYDKHNIRSHYTEHHSLRKTEKKVWAQVFLKSKLLLLC